MRQLYDGINSLAPAIHADFGSPALVAGYVNGAYAWSSEEWNLFPHSAHVTITVTASANAGDVLDVERGDASPDEAYGWIRMRKAAGLFRPTIYCARGNLPAVRAGSGSYVLGQDYDVWVADWTGSAHEVSSSVKGGVAARCAAVQYRSTGSYDASAVYDDGWPHRSAPSPKPAPKPSPKPASADLWPSGVTLRQGSTGNAVKALQYALRDSGLRLSATVGTVDGDYGPKTLAAVEAYQRDEGLAADGIAGPATRASMVSHGFLTPAGEGT